MAQRIERLPPEQKIVGSIPAGDTGELLALTQGALSIRHREDLPVGYGPSAVLVPLFVRNLWYASAMNANYWVKTMGLRGFYIHREDHVSAFFEVPEGVSMDSDGYGNMLVDSLPDDDTIKEIARSGINDGVITTVVSSSAGMFTWFVTCILAVAMDLNMVVSMMLASVASFVVWHSTRKYARAYKYYRTPPRHLLDPNFIFRHHPARTDSMYPLCRRQDYER